MKELLGIVLNDKTTRGTPVSTLKSLGKANIEVAHLMPCIRILYICTYMTIFSHISKLLTVWPSFRKPLTGFPAICVQQDVALRELVMLMSQNLGNLWRDNDLAINGKDNNTTNSRLFRTSGLPIFCHGNHIGCCAKVAARGTRTPEHPTKEGYNPIIYPKIIPI